MRIGFANVDIKLADIKGEINLVKAEIKALDSKFDERTKGIATRLDGKEAFERNASTGLIVTVVGGLLLTLAKFLFFGYTP